MARLREQPETRRVFDISFKLKIVRMAKAQGLSIGQLCKDIKLVEIVTTALLGQFEAVQLGQNRIGKRLTAEHQRIRQLEQEN